MLLLPDPEPAVIQPDLRSSVHAFSPNTARSIIDRTREGLATRKYRLVLQILCVVQIFAVLLPTLAIAGTLTTTSAAQTIVRSLCLGVSLLLSSTMAYAMGRVTEVESNLTGYLAACIFCTALEASLFIIADGLPTLFFFGLVAMTLRVLQLLVVGLALRTCHTALPRDELYSRFADVDEGAAKIKTDNAVEDIVRTLADSHAREGARDSATKQAAVSSGVDSCDQNTLDKVVMEAHFVHQEEELKSLIADSGGNTFAEAADSIRDFLHRAIALEGVNGNNESSGREYTEEDGSSPSKLNSSSNKFKFAQAAQETAKRNRRPSQDEDDLLQTVHLAVNELATSSHIRDMVKLKKMDQLRTSLFVHDRSIRTQLAIILLVLFLCTTGNIVYEMFKIFLNQPPIFATSFTEYHNQKSNFQYYFPQRSHSTWKVHVVVVDGLRYDLSEPGSSSFGDYVASLGNNAYRLRARAQLPSFSVPNWLSILTGSSPENTGVTGNLQNGETGFDTIFRQAENFNLSTGMTGTPWWALLVESRLPKLSGDGTIDASFVPDGTPAYPKTTSDPADWARLAVALAAIRRSTVTSPFGAADFSQFYSLFLTHFSDVDAQGHAYGISTKYNTDNSYLRAVANKTTAIRRIVDAIDTNTVLIITSDHGHLQRGGHGGTESELLDVPIIFYTKGVALKPSVLTANTNFPKTLFPLSERFEHLYENTDIAATICALLGIPSPRQSIGILIEEIVELLVPAGVRTKHYYDLLVAKLSVVMLYNDLLEATLWKGARFKVPHLDAVRTLVATNGSLTAKAYADGVRLILPAYERMREIRMNFILLRNLLVSVVIAVGLLLVVGMLFSRSACGWMSLVAPPASSISTAHDDELTDDFVNGNNIWQHVRKYNVRALVTAAIVLVLVVGLSIAVFFIAYAIVGYDVWSSTLTHSPDAAPRFIIYSIIAPMMLFLLLTRFAMFRHVHWYSWNIVAELKLTKWVDTAGNIVRWTRYLISDLQTVFVVPMAYTTRGMLQAYLFVLYLTFGVLLHSIALLFLTFSFSFIVPIMFSTSHVTEDNLRFRFRIVTLLLMAIPSQLGCIVLLLTMPACNHARALLQWDLVFLVGYVFPDTIQVRKEKEARRNQIAPETAAMRVDVARRKALLEQTSQLLLKPESRTGAECW